MATQADAFKNAGTVYAVAEKSGYAPAVAIISVTPMTVYVTASYQELALEATSGGTAGAGAEGTKMICRPVELTSADATVKDALVALAKQYYNSSYSSSTNYLDATADYWGVATTNSLSTVASYILVNGVEATWGALSGSVSDGDHIIADMGAYDANYNPQMTPTLHHRRRRQLSWIQSAANKHDAVIQCRLLYLQYDNLGFFPCRDSGLRLQRVRDKRPV